MKQGSVRRESRGGQRTPAKPVCKGYLLKLYVTGATSKSMLAIKNIKALCEANLKGRYVLEVVDIYQTPVRAKEDQILAAPTLIKYEPEPVRRLIGDMTDTDRVLHGLDLPVAKTTKKGPDEDNM
jgi:circadian clock protein KaiB